jgi:hypothetical protein
MTDNDPLAPGIELALQHGWILIPQIGTGDNALMRFNRPWTDVVTIPLIGPSTVVRYLDGPPPGNPRTAAPERWRHQVPPPLALRWLLTNPENDHELRAWRPSPRRHR